MNAVVTLGVTDVIRVRLHRIGGIKLPVSPLIPHAVFAFVGDDAEVDARVAFPRLIAGENDFLRLGVLQLEPNVVEFIDQKIIDEQFAPRPDIDRFFLRGQIQHWQDHKTNGQRDRYGVTNSQAWHGKLHEFGVSSWPAPLCSLIAF